MSYETWTPINCPVDQGTTLMGIVIAASQRSAIGKCPDCGRRYEIVSTAGPPVTFTLEELKRDSA